MVLFNHATREMTAKIVYYGPGLCGKTTNLLVIFDKLDPQQKGKMLSLATKTDRTLFFDLLPVDIGKVGAFNLKIQLYTVPGQVFYNETRKLVLKGADSVVFVADSQPSMIESNRESFANLMDNLHENQLDPNDTPIIIQFNKRDIPGVLSIEKLQEALQLDGYPYAEASAIKGEGVMETFKLASKITAKHLMAKLKGKSEPIERKKSQPRPAPVAPAEERPQPRAKQPAQAEAPNPFADSVPFPESAPIDSGYEGMEEVSLEQLLEGRERPSTMSGDVAIPIEVSEDVEELATDEMVSFDDPPLAVAVMEEAVSAISAPPSSSSADTAALREEVEKLRGQLGRIREDRRTTLASILQDLEELTERVRNHIG